MKVNKKIDFKICINMQEKKNIKNQKHSIFII